MIRKLSEVEPAEPTLTEQVKDTTHSRGDNFRGHQLWNKHRHGPLKNWKLSRNMTKLQDSRTDEEKVLEVMETQEAAFIDTSVPEDVTDQREVTESKTAEVEMSSPTDVSPEPSGIVQAFAQLMGDTEMNLLNLIKTSDDIFGDPFDLDVERAKSKPKDEAMVSQVEVEATEQTKTELDEQMPETAEIAEDTKAELVEETEKVEEPVRRKAEEKPIEVKVDVAMPTKLLGLMKLWGQEADEQVEETEEQEEEAGTMEQTEILLEEKVETVQEAKTVEEEPPEDRDIPEKVRQGTLEQEGAVETQEVTVTEEEPIAEGITTTEAESAEITDDISSTSEITLIEEKQDIEKKEEVLPEGEKTIIEISMERSEHLDLAPSFVGEPKAYEIDSGLLETAQKEVKVLVVEEEEEEEEEFVLAPEMQETADKAVAFADELPSSVEELWSSEVIELVQKEVIESKSTKITKVESEEITKTKPTPDNRHRI